MFWCNMYTVLMMIRCKVYTVSMTFRLFLTMNLVCLCLSDGTCESSGFRISPFYNNLKPIEIPVFDGVVANKLECANTCFGLLDSNCRSFSFKKKDKMCSIYDNRLDSFAFSQDNGTRNYEAVPMSQFDCYDVMLNGHKRDGVYTIISRDVSAPMHAFCELSSNGPGWLVFQRRTDGSQDFYKSWDEYNAGFGNLTNEFWLGNLFIETITTRGLYELRIDLEDFDGNTSHALYDGFSLKPTQEFYELVLGNYTGTAGDSLSYHGGYQFTAHDNDRDQWTGGNCAELRNGGWWYNDCSKSNLNGLYLQGHHDEVGVGIDWYAWHGSQYSLKTTEMKLRRKLKLVP